jgi:hypothetical protein
LTAYRLHCNSYTDRAANGQRRNGNGYANG